MSRIGEIPAGKRAGKRSRPAARRFALLALALGIWGASLATAWSRLYSHAYQATETGRGVPRWPQGTLLGETASRFRIVVFVHPFCPCTAATVRELDESLTRIPDDVTIDAIAVTAGFSPEELLRSRTLEALRRMPRVRLHSDPEGHERALFGAVVSGETFGFDPHGRRVFHGGVTPGRGHQGDADGQRELEDLAAGRRQAPAEAPVFGCRLPGAESPRTALADSP